MEDHTFLIKGDFIWSHGPGEFKAVRNGTAVCRNGRCEGIFRPDAEIPAAYAGAPIADDSGRLIIPAFTDLHIHAPQYAFRGLGMDLELFEWLTQNAFPEEARFADQAYAEEAYGLFADELRHSGTARAVVFGTLHTDATLILMKKMEEAGLVSMVGKVNMDRNSPADLCESSAQQSLSETRRWLTAWKGLGLAHTSPIITPRFIPSCSDELMRGLSQLAMAEHLPIQSHLSENPSENELVARLCPQSSCYGDAYRQFGTLSSGSGCVMAHCVWSSDEEIAILRDNHTFIAHCPACNANVASGIAPARRYLDEGMKIGLGTDVAGGHTKSILDSMKEAVQVSKLYWRYVDKTRRPLTIQEVFYMATVGGGEFFGRVGAFEKGLPFDALVLDEAQIRTTWRDMDLSERLERFIYLADDRDILHKYVGGVQLF